MAASTESPARLEQTLLGAGLFAGGANVIMQLARPGVGYGVVESKVEGGQLFRHPVKRTRTTLSYLAVALRGTAAERELYQHGVNRAHATVRSDASSPVAYDAFDPELQLWVAACIYKGLEDVQQIFGVRVEPATQDQLYRESAVLGTTLQVPLEMWPADRAAFEVYWNNSLRRVSIDPPVRDYLYQLATLRFLPRVLSVPFGALNRFVTTGFLPPRFREEMRLPWSSRSQRRFDRLMATIGVVVRRLPPVLREFPFNLCMWDLRRRIDSGRPLV